jgi:hypothetical protein
MIRGPGRQPAQNRVKATALRDVAVKRPALDQLKIEVGRVLEDRVAPGLTVDPGEDRQPSGSVRWHDRSPGARHAELFLSRDVAPGDAVSLELERPCRQDGPVASFAARVNGMTAWCRRVVTQSKRRLAARFRQRGRPAVAWTLRVTLASVAAYVGARWTFPHAASPPLLAPLTALLVVRLTPVSILVSGLDRVLSVVAGVSLAALLSAVVGLTWWSLGLLIGISLVVGQILRLGPNLLEVPISAMLVLGVGAAGAQSAAGERVAETLVGAVVGVLSNLLFPPRVVAPDAGEAIDDMAGEFARLLEDAGDELGSQQAEGRWLADRSGDWLGRARRLTHDIPNVGAVLLQAEEGRRFNLRALRTPDAGPGLRQGLEALEHSAVAVRSTFGTLESVARGHAEAGRQIDPQLRQAFALVLNELAGGLRSFGRMVRQEAHPAEGVPDPQRMRAALEGLNEARARVTDLLLVGPRDDPLLGQFIAVLGSTVERLLRELDLDERIRRQPQRRPRRRPGPRSVRTSDRPRAGAVTPRDP